MSQLPEFLRITRKRRVDDAAVSPPVTNPLNEPTADVAANSAPSMTRPRTVAPVNAPSLAESAGVDESGTTATRPRIVDRPQHLEKQIAYEGEHPAQEHNGRLKSTLKEIAVNAALGFMQGGLPGAVRGGIGGGAVGALHPAADEERQQEGRVYQWQKTLANLRENEKRKLALDEQRAGVRTKNAQAAYYEARPDIEAQKQQAAALHREQNAVMANLRML